MNTTDSFGFQVKPHELRKKINVSALEKTEFQQAPAPKIKEADYFKV